MPLRTRELVEHILSIDVGSTAGREIFVEAGDPKAHVPIENTEGAAGSIFNKADMTTLCCPFKPDPLNWIGPRARDEPEAVSLKYLLYLLVDTDDKLLERYPMSERLRNMRGNAEFKQTCRAIIVEWLKQLRRKADTKADQRAIYYNKIVFTVPFNWTKPFQEVYLDMIEEAFPDQYAADEERGVARGDNITIMAEADALAHYIIKAEWKSLQDWNTVLFIDFGGHSMASYPFYSGHSYARFVLEDNADGSFRYYLIEDDVGGSPGGGEMFLHHIGEVIVNKLKLPVWVDGRRQTVPDPEGKLAHSFTRAFQKQLVMNADDILTNKVTPLYLQQSQGTVCISLCAEEIRDCFRRGLASPLALAKQQLELLAERANADTNVRAGVIVAGGGLRSDTAKKEFKELCPAMFLDENNPQGKSKLKFADDYEAEYRSLFIARGAGQAMADQTTVPDFFNFGAGLYLQKKMNALSNDLWEDGALLALDLDGSYNRQFYTKSHQDLELKIICDPVSANRTRKVTDYNQFLSVKACYDLYNLGRLEAGTTTVKITFHNEYNEGGAAISHLEVKLTRKTGGKGAPKPKVKTVLLPLFFDKGHNCVHVDLDKLSPDAHDEQGTDRHAIESLNRQTVEPEPRLEPRYEQQLLSPFEPSAFRPQAATEPNTGRKIVTTKRTGSGGGHPLALNPRDQSSGPSPITSRTSGGSDILESIKRDLEVQPPQRINNKRGPGGSVMGVEIDPLGLARSKKRTARVKPIEEETGW
ncbi:hypothetical protein OQA88_7625 [Cercophora sp. LCS_1]